MQKTTSDGGTGLTAGRMCLLLEFCWIYPFYTGSYVIFSSSSPDGAYYLAGGLVAGLILAIIFALAIPKKVQGISVASAAIAFASAIIATYASLFFIEIVEWISMVVLGTSGTLLFVSTCYLDLPRGNRAIVEGLATAVLFLTFNAWLVGTSWAFRHVGIACAAAILLVSMVRLPTGAMRVGKVGAASPLLSTLAGIHGVIVLVSGTIFAIIALSWIQSNGEESLVQGTVSDTFVYSGLIVAVCLSLMSILNKARKAPRSDGLGLAIFTASSAFEICVMLLYLTNVGTTDIDVELFLFPGAIAIALVLLMAIILERTTRRTHVMAIVVLVLVFAGVAFMSNMNYPVDWTPLGIIVAPVALAGTAIGVLWLLIKRPWVVVNPATEVEKR